MRRTWKISISFLIALIVVLVFLISVPFLFKNKIAEGVKSVANSRLKTELGFSDMDISFFSHFPRLTIMLKNFSLKSSPPFNTDTLISAKEVSLGIDVMSLFGKVIRINRVYLDRAHVEIKYNEKGASNFDVYKSSDTTASSKDTTSTTGAEVNIEEITFSGCHFVYSDPSIPVKLELKGFNYKGKSRLSKDILSLTSGIRVDSLDFILNNQYYLRSKPITASLTTKINISSLEIFFEKNDMKIKDMPVNFNGRFSFQKDGYTLSLRLLSIYENEVFSAALHLNSTDKLYLFARINTILNLAKWSKALGVDQVDLHGMINFNLNAEGIYETGQNPKNKKPDTVLLSIPKFTVSSRLTGGYLKYIGLPQALTGITFDLDAGTPDNNYKHIWAKIEKLKARFLKNNIEGFIYVKGLQDLPVQAKLQTRCNLSELKQLVPMDSLDLSGMLDINVDVSGNYAPGRKLFPVSQVNLSLRDGSLQTKYYPHPLEKIGLIASISNSTGKLQDTRLTLSPLSFIFEGNQFEIRADIRNPDNIVYSVTSKGVLDVARIYKIFARKGMELDGRIETDLSLHGKQSDALGGHYERLNNKGRLILRNIGFGSEYLTKKIILRDGVFRFDNDNLWFEKFAAQYGSSDIRLDGHVSNVVNYVLSDKQKLKGSFQFNSKYLFLDEFMAPANGENVGTTPSETTIADGVIIIPENLEIGLKVNLKKTRFRDLDIHELVATAEIRGGMILLKEMQFELIGARVAMDASYGSINPSRGFFDFHVDAKDFDVKRAYNEVALFRNLSSSAANAEGIVSLDYNLKGKLNTGMSPVYPSLEGGGTLTLKKVKVMGLKLFNVISKSTEKEKLKNPDLSKVEFKTTIKNNVITLEQTKIKISGFRLKLSGTTNFNGDLNLKMRIGLPPLGIFGIPLRVLGTSDNPKLKYGRGSSNGHVEETEYTDEMPADLKEKLRNAKEEDLKDDEPDVK
ncbi:MAG: AsmA family protein [Bacteroidales bacterium]|jgi:AsmA protein|nr:AsmA family protein [Bacteroidales bacterium]